MKIVRFEEIEAWKSARKMMNLVYDATSGEVFRSDLDLRRQIRRASSSSMANIAEGFDSGSNPEFVRFLRIAQRSTTEIQSHLYVCLDRGYFNQKVFDSVYRKADDTKNLIGGFIRYLNSAIARDKAHNKAQSPTHKAPTTTHIEQRPPNKTKN